MKFASLVSREDAGLIYNRPMTRPLLWILVAGVVLRLFVLVFASHAVGTESFLKGDPIIYVNLAENIIQGEGFVTDLNGTLIPELFRTPGLPLLLSPFMLFNNSLLLYGIFMSVLCGVLMPLLTYLIASRVVTNTAALLASALMAIEPHAIFYSFLPQTEGVFIVFALAGLYYSLRAYELRSYVSAVASGALIAYATLIRPSYLIIFFLQFAGVAVYLYFRRRETPVLLATSLVVMFLVLSPWMIRNNNLSGTYALSAAGWRNVYSEYLASLRSIENGRPFYVESKALQDEAMEKFGFSPSDINNPINGRVLRDAALSEIVKKPVTVLKLESTVIGTFFLSDGYYYEFRNMGFVSDTPGGHISPTFELLRHGTDALPAIWNELSRQKFIPILGRGFTMCIFLLSLLGIFLIQHKIKYLFIAVIALTGLFATAIGLGVDARMRIPVEPLMFIFAASACMWLYKKYGSLWGNMSSKQAPEVI